MGVINEVDFRSSMKSLLKRIEQKTTDINNIFDGIKMDFADAEKMLVARSLKTLDEKLQEYKGKDWSYDKIKGSWGISICFRCGDWEEFKKYSEFIKDDSDNKALNEHLSHSFRKYGLKHGGITKSSYNGEVEFSYRITKSWCPGIGGEGFFIDKEKEDNK